MEFLTQDLHRTRLENASLQEKNQLPPPGTIPTVAPPPPIPPPEEYLGLATVMDVIMRQKSQPSGQPLPTDSQFSNSFIVPGQINTGIRIVTMALSKSLLTIIIAEGTSTGLLDPSLFYIYDDFAPPLKSIPVWEARPCHYPATCRNDKIFLELIETRKSINNIEASALEFQNPRFPHMSAFLNPQHHAELYPFTAAIVSVSCLLLMLRRKLTFAASNTCLVSGESPRASKFSFIIRGISYLI